MAASADEHVDTLISDDTTTPTTTTSTPISTTIVTVPPFDPTVLTDYLAELASVILNASRDDLQLSLLSYSDTLQKCSKFATDPSNLVLYLRKEFGDATSQNNNDISENTAFVYYLSTEYSAGPTTVASLALMKRPQPLDPSIPLQSQLVVVNLPGQEAASPYEILHSLVRSAVSPYFDSYARGETEQTLRRGKGLDDAKTGIPLAKKKIAELELSLLHLQQNVEIPEIILPIPPLVQNAIAQAQAKNIRPTTSLLPQDLISDPVFLNGIQGTVNSWIKSIQTITKMNREPSSGTASQEINFWISMENALDSIERQLKSDGVTLTLDLLRQAKRFHATVSFIADTGLKEAAEKVQKYNQLMREFPINELLSATSLNRLQEAVILIFGHLTKKLRISPYPIRRALPLVEAISGDLDTQLHNLLSGRRLMHYEYSEFEKLMNASDEVFHTWDDQLKEFTNVAREVTRKRSEKFIPIKIVPKHKDTQERLQYLRTFRKAHEQLQRTVANVVEAHESAPSRRGDDGIRLLSESFGDMDAVGEVRQAYESLKDVDVLDLSSDGTELWVAAENSYNERIAQVENAIIARLRERLAKASTANEMFRVFSKYNALFVRPKIRGAIQEYQNQLIDNVKADIAALHDRFKLQYGNSEAHAMAQLRDLPPISGAIIWARQIERQLNTYMRRVEDVLGKGWELYAEGQKLQNESMIFRNKLDTRAIYDAWLQDVSLRQLTITGYIFKIVHNRASGSLQLQVNFDRQIITLFKEVRNFVWLNFQVPHAISNVSKEAKRVYPHAVALMETVRTYTQTIRKIDAMSSISTLLSGFRMEVQNLIAKGMQMKWESFVHSFDPHHRGPGYLANGSTDGSAHPVRESRHIQFVRDFASATSTLQTKTDTLIEISDKVSHSLNDLKTCQYTSTAFSEAVHRIQDLVDRLNLENYVNLGIWVEQLNSTMQEILLGRLKEAIVKWTTVFSSDDHSSEIYSHKGRKVVSTNEDKLKSRQINLKPIFHELIIRNQVIFLEPPLEHARTICFSSLYQWLGVVCSLPRVQASRYEISVHKSCSDMESSSNYSSLLHELANSELKAAYLTIENRMSEAASYVDRWLQFQSLWDLQADQVYNALGDDLSNWLQILTEIRKSRATFDTSEVVRSFGVIAITFEQVQSRVNAKYDAWQRDIVQHFAGVLSSAMNASYSELKKARTDLERQSLETSNTAQAVSFITIVQKSEQKTTVWAPLVDIFQKSQLTLSRERYHYPDDWLDVEQVNAEWSAFKDILARKSKQVQDQIHTLRDKILDEDRQVGKKISNLVAEWNSEKPVAGNIPPENALATLANFEGRFRSTGNDYETVAKAKEALDLQQSPPNPVLPLLEELQDFKSVWTALSRIWDSLKDLRETLWTSVAPRKIRQSLDSLVAITKDMPSRMRQYSAFEYVQGVLQKLIKINPLLSELKSDSIKERHWTKLFKSCRSRDRYLPSTLSLGIVWDLDLSANETILRDVIVQAQGEMALEEYLRQVRETWTNYILDLVNYQNKCRLVKGWDDLFAKCGENLNSLTAMKFSPYYKVFEEDASHWEDRLNRIHVIFDIWIDVQRQWVYLEGIFAGNADIKQLLPVESSRFQNINSEFLSLMKKVSKSPSVMDVLNIQNLQKSLERLADLLSKIQKALGEYLERERAAFPRFYFVGDEDLLELIGNSRDVVRAQKHFRKMFAGLHSLRLSDDLSTIIGISSKEGESVPLLRQISFARNPKINDWLSVLEHEMKQSLAALTSQSIQDFTSIFSTEFDRDSFLSFLDRFPAQVVLLSTQVVWTRSVEEILSRQTDQSLANLQDRIEHILKGLAETVLLHLETIQRKKCEHLITEMVHQRDVIGSLIENGVSSVDGFNWLYQMRFYHIPDGEVISNLVVRMADASFTYGYEYLGVGERLVQTPLTDRCYLTLTQALSQRLGGSPFGPAGTGKTESVKALGGQLGRFVLVFCCDDTFDFKAMARIFLGICQVGAWGCFDEFNRLEERILSAVSQQIQSIQLGLQSLSDTGKATIDLTGRSFELHKDTGIFITMNPGYAGRSNLPDNLKKLFRSVAMTKPDKELITQVMLYSQGFQTAKQLASRIVPFFDQCLEKLSHQTHYDFGLRALKSVLVTSGNLKRGRYQEGFENGTDGIAEFASEAKLIIQALHETVAPKLVGDDVYKLTSIEAQVFPGVEYEPARLIELVEEIKSIAGAQHLIVSDTWLTKVLQLYQIQAIHHGVMMVGASGTGKSTAWRVLLEALGKVDGIEGVSYVIDPKVMSKEALYGSLDSTTREWTDGLFTQVLRRIIDNVRGEGEKRHWIVFDGDVDPIWVENLNSVLDDNKMLTLPNGERLNLPATVRILFEVETLKYATPATVSRCGMVWFSGDIVDSDMLVRHYTELLKHSVFEDLDEDGPAGTLVSGTAVRDSQSVVVDVVGKYFSSQFISKALQRAKDFNHIMEFTDTRALNTLFSLIQRACRTIIEYNDQHSDFPLEYEQIEHFISRKLLLCFIWSFAGDCPLSTRQVLGDFLSGLTTISVPVGSALLDFNVTLPSATWDPWQEVVPERDVDPQDVNTADTVIPTVDTVRHEEILYSWMSEHRPVILCGPPGSGKTMTLFNALRKLPNFEVASINFSSATTPDLVVKSLEQYCEYRKTMNGTILAPAQIGRWLVLFCDEINLPAPDTYGTQRVISFMRQLVEQGGFWRSATRTWITLERIQFVGACNPPTDAGRVPLSPRFLRHSPVIMVDYPGTQSLRQIYSTFVRGVLKCAPDLRGFADSVTRAMVEFYSQSQSKYTAPMHSHYIYSPRELTRWVRGIYEAIRPLEGLRLEDLVRIWAHEGLRLFQDRLVGVEERIWTRDTIFSIAEDHFPGVDLATALSEPIMFSNWLSKFYVSVDREVLREFTKSRLKTFCEEEVDVPLVLFNDVLDHVLRIDRVFRQPQGHLILIGISGSGKTTLARFVAWMNGLKVYQIKVHGKYSAGDFDDDLKDVLRRAGCKGEKICFIMDEANVLDSAFLERMNTLLANAEIPGLFEGDEYNALMTSCKEGAQRDGLLLDTPEELYRWFTQQIIKNLHVVFTMNPPETGLSSKAAASPALFNRCVLNWMGTWSDQAYYQVGMEFTRLLDLEVPGYQAPSQIPVAYGDLPLPPTHRQAIVNAMVFIHVSVANINHDIRQRKGTVTFLTPRHYLDFVNQYVRLYTEKRDDLEEQQRHLNVGLEKLNDTVKKVSELRSSLAEKQKQLERTNTEANAKLQQMVADQKETEQKRIASLEIQTSLDQQEHQIAERTKAVLEDLANAEPAVEEARKSVSNIKKQHLTEVRSMQNPPEAVKLAMESVCSLLGNRVDGWKSVQAVIRKDDFIASIVNYDNERQMTRPLRAKMQAEYLSNPNFTFEIVNRASKACGPLVQWVAAQVHYSSILDKVGPLREEVKALQQRAEDTRMKAETITEMIEELEKSIARYKEEYAELISQTQAIKDEMTRVQSKVDRSMKLLDSLSSERQRWDKESKAFEDQIGTLAGDVLLAAAFLSYSGFYDQQYRRIMLQTWRQQLQNSGIGFKEEQSMIEYLCTADDKLQWQEHSLPNDEVCLENAIILKRFDRYPLIIDPSNRATEFLLQEFKERKLVVTSFLDDSFIKHLESAIRFGNPILIQDAEHLDPVLNHVLNKEYQRTGGRVLVRLGKQEIDFAPSFRLFMSTRNPSAAFTPDICSRVTFVNFTITKASLRTQSLNQVLKAERPDVDQKRTNLIKAQGEFRLHLRRLERKLLEALNASKGNILDDDVVLDTLQTLKSEAAEIARKVVKTEEVMEEVQNIMDQYEVIASACTTIYVILEQLNNLNHFYRFSLDYFQEIFKLVLATHHRDSKNPQARISHLVNQLYITTFQWTSRSLLHRDHLVLALLLAQAASLELHNDTFAALLSASRDPNHKGISLSHVKFSNDLDFDTDELKNAISRHSEMTQLLNSDDVALSIPTFRDHNELALAMILIQLFRPERLMEMSERFINEVFGTDLSAEIDYDFRDVVQKTSTCLTPVALVSVPGYDASYKVEQLVKQVNVRCTSIAMGSGEGISQAELALNSASKTGSWILLKNVHLAPQWLDYLEKRLHGIQPHPDFRLFMTMETNPRVPVNLISMSRVFMFEPPPGIKANLTNSLRGLSSHLVTKMPVERVRVYFLLAWLHAVIQERLRYVPLGWSKGYEFSEADFDAAAITIDRWIEHTASGRSNIAPEKIPWRAISTLLSECVYGGRVDEESDQKLLSSLIAKYFTPKAFELDFKLVNEFGQVVVIPDGSRLESFKSWTNKLPEREPPVWLGLPDNSERLLYAEQGKLMLQSVGKIWFAVGKGNMLGS